MGVVNVPGHHQPRPHSRHSPQQSRATMSAINEPLCWSMRDDYVNCLWNQSVERRFRLHWPTEVSSIDANTVQLTLRVLEDGGIAKNRLHLLLPVSIVLVVAIHDNLVLEGLLRQPRVEVLCILSGTKLCVVSGVYEDITGRKIQVPVPPVSVTDANHSHSQRLPSTRRHHSAQQPEGAENASNGQLLPAACQSSSTCSESEHDDPVVNEHRHWQTRHGDAYF
mmetsp:Transcript_22966/g.53735  ORF Transcript_22966/g.53735 Transcript_22966/m.53735 type:complete len:223 (-) Transcript_22966:188-856(-)